MIDFDPPILGCVVSNGNYSFQRLKTTRECVINIPTVELASKVVKCGNSLGGWSTGSLPSVLPPLRPPG
jgi:flavin reductase (DIM6/NTAB) family NADH-FMN oxidoreductase RutF